MLGAIAGTIGASAGPLATLYGQERANQANQASANKQMVHQRWMSEHQHQMQVQDLRKAGLNPLLSANSGASVGAGASATNENSLGEAASSALDTRRLKAEIDKTNSEINLNAQMGKKAIQDAATSKAVENVTNINATSAKGDPRYGVGKLVEVIQQRNGQSAKQPATPKAPIPADQWKWQQNQVPLHTK